MDSLIFNVIINMSTAHLISKRIDEVLPGEFFSPFDPEHWLRIPSGKLESCPMGAVFMKEWRVSESAVGPVDVYDTERKRGVGVSGLYRAGELN
jgi:hypothetical protein